MRLWRTPFYRVPKVQGGLPLISQAKGRSRKDGNNRQMTGFVTVFQSRIKPFMVLSGFSISPAPDLENKKKGTIYHAAVCGHH